MAGPKCLEGDGEKHERQGRQVCVVAPADVFTSAPWKGWRRHGLLSVREVPASA